MLEIITAPNPLLVTNEVAREHLSMDPAVDDAELNPLIAAASAAVQTYIGRPLAVGEFRETLRLTRPVPDLPVSRWPLVAVSAVTVDGVALDVATDIEAENDTGLVRRLTGKGRYQCWPVSVVTIEYRAGFETVPADIQQAVLTLVGDAWAKRGRDPGLKSIAIGSISLGYLDPNARAALSVVEPLLAPYRQPSIG